MTVQRLSYLVPFAVVSAIGAFTSISWWALAMVGGGAIFIWDWLWGVGDLMRPGGGWWFIVAGVTGLLISYLLANHLGLGIPEFLALASGAARRARWVYNMPAASVSLMIYGGLIVSRAGR